MSEQQPTTPTPAPALTETIAMVLYPGRFVPSCTASLDTMTAALVGELSPELAADLRENAGAYVDEIGRVGFALVNYTEALQRLHRVLWLYTPREQRNARQQPTR